MDDASRSLLRSAGLTVGYLEGLANDVEWLCPVRADQIRYRANNLRSAVNALLPVHEQLTEVPRG